MNRKYVFVLMVIFNTLKVDAQYYPYDSIPVKYEVISIRNAKQAYIIDLQNILKERKEKAYYKNQMADILIYTNLIKKIKYFNLYNLSKKAYLIIMKNIENGKCFYVVSIKKNNIKGKKKKIKVGKIYEMKLETYYKSEARAMDIGMVYAFEIQGNKIRIVENIFVDNIYISTNLKGLYYIPCK